MISRIRLLHQSLLAICLLATAVLAACSGDKSLLNQEQYEGPVLVMDSIITRYSDEGVVTFRLESPKELKFENGDKSWPEGMNLEMYDVKTQEKTTTFEADKVYYTLKDDLYKGEGDVMVVNVKTGERLETEELFWDPGKKQFYTERFVTIIDEDGLATYGEGLTASQDFSEYEITKALGEKNLKQGDL